jgi:hypothetical protein
MSQTIADICRATGEQRCHLCGDLKCGDNTTNEAELRRLQVLRRAVRRFLDQYEEHVNAARPAKEVIIYARDLNELQEAYVGIAPEDTTLNFMEKK